MNSKPTSRRPLEMPAGLRVSAYDRVAGMIVALLVLVGFAVLVLVLLWLADRAMAGHEQPPVALVPEDPAAGMTLGTAHEMVEPGVSEFADAETPQLADSLAAVTTSVTMQQARLEELFGDDSLTGAGQGAGNVAASGSGGAESLEKLAPVRSLSLRTTGVTSYARMLDALGIEIGVLGGGIDGITYVSRLSDDAPVVRSGTGEQENRFYFSQDSRLVELDRQLLAKAGIDSHNRVIVYFVPAAGEQQILTAEGEHAQLASEEILQTTFGVRAAGDGYEFYVIQQHSRP